MEPLHYFIIGALTGGAGVGLVVQYVNEVRRERERRTTRHPYEARRWPR